MYLRIFILTFLGALPIHNVFAYTDRSLLSYFTGNILWRMLTSGGYYTLGILLILGIISSVSKSFRIYVISCFIAFCAVYLLVLIYEVLEAMSWVPPMYPS